MTREAAVRNLILGSAVLCYVAALAIAGAGMRVPAAQPTRAGQLVPAEAPPIIPSTPSTTPAPAPSPEVPPPFTSEPAAAPFPQSPAGQLKTTVEDLAREQAASRELVTELRATVAQLQQEIERQSAALHGSEPQGRTVTVFCCDLLPPGQETPAPEAKDLLRSVLPEIMADTRQVVSVEGHSDSRPILAGAGKRFKNNTDLSLLRARAVASLLQQQGVAAGRIRVKGWGDTRPLATNDTAEGRDRNRRVEIRLLPPSPEL
jgi:flagellar motor protein MotB